MNSCFGSWITLIWTFWAETNSGKILQHFYWPGINNDVCQWCTQCSECQKGNCFKKLKAPLAPLLIVDEPFRRVAIDIVEPLQQTENKNRYILTCMDFATKYPEAIPLQRIDAATVAEALMGIFTKTGVPSEILSDHGTNFMSSLMENLMTSLGIHHITTLPYHPQTNGMLKRFHATLKTMLRKTCQAAKQWDHYLPYLCSAYRDMVHATTGFSPFQLVFGRDVRGPLTLFKE